MYTGPFLITEVIGPVNVRLQASKRAQPFITHIDKLKLCLGETPNNWLSTGNQEAVDTEDEMPGLTDVRFLREPEENETVITTVNEQLNLEIEELPQSAITTEEAEQSQVESRPRRETRRPSHLRDFV